MTRALLLVLVVLPVLPLALSAPSFVPRFCVRFKASCQAKPNHMCCRGVIPTTSTTTTTTTISTSTISTTTSRSTAEQGLSTQVPVAAGDGEKEEVITFRTTPAEDVDVKEHIEEETEPLLEDLISLDEPDEILEAEPSTVDEVIAIVDVDSELNLISTTTAKPTKFAPKFCLLLKFNCATRKSHVCCRYPLPGKDAGRRPILKQPKIQTNQGKPRPKPAAQPKPPPRTKPARKNFLSRTRQEKRTSTLAPSTSTTEVATTTTKRALAQRRNVLLPRICKRLVVNCRQAAGHQCCKGFVPEEQVVDAPKEDDKEPSDEVNENIIDTENEPPIDPSIVAEKVDSLELHTEDDVVVSKSASVSSSTSRIVQITSPRRPTNSRIALPRRPITSRVSSSSVAKRPNVSRRRSQIAPRPVSRIVSSNTKPNRQPIQNIFERKRQRPSFFSAGKSRSTTPTLEVSTENIAASHEEKTDLEAQLGTNVTNEARATEPTSVTSESSTTIVSKATSFTTESTSIIAESSSSIPQSTSTFPQVTSSSPTLTTTITKSTSTTTESASIISELTSIPSQLSQFEKEAPPVISELAPSNPESTSRVREEPLTIEDPLSYPIDFDDDYSIEDYPQLSNPNLPQFSSSPLIAQTQPIIEIQSSEPVDISPVFIAEKQNIVPQFIVDDKNTLPQFIAEEENIVPQFKVEKVKIVPEFIAEKENIVPQFKVEKVKIVPQFIAEKENIVPQFTAEKVKIVPQFIAEKENIVSNLIAEKENIVPQFIVEKEKIAPQFVVEKEKIAPSFIAEIGNIVPEFIGEKEKVSAQFINEQENIVPVFTSENIVPEFIPEKDNIVPQFIDSQIILNQEVTQETTAEEKEIISEILSVKFHDDSAQEPSQIVEKISPQFGPESESSLPVFIVSSQTSSVLPSNDNRHHIESPIQSPESNPSPIFIPDSQFNPLHTSPQFILESLPKPINPGFIIETLDEAPEFLQSSGPVLKEFDLPVLTNPGFVSSPRDFSPPHNLIPKATIEIVSPPVLQRTNILDPNQITPRVSGECFRFDCLSSPSHFCCAPHQTQKRQTLPQSLPEKFSFVSSFPNFPLENIEPFMLQHPGLITATVTRVEKSVQGW